MVDEIGKLLGGLAALAWPGVIGTGLFYFRNEAKQFVQAVRRQFNAGATFKVKDIEIRGLALDTIHGEARGNWVYAHTSAAENDFQARDAIYKKNRNLFLVHTTVRTDEFHPKNGFRLFEMSIFLAPHQRYAAGSNIEQFGRVNEVDEVIYYFGRYWGSGEFGQCFRVRNGTDGFAVRFRAYGPSLCVATVRFHDGEEIKLERYIDVESVGGMKSGDADPNKDLS